MSNDTPRIKHPFEAEVTFGSLKSMRQALDKLEADLIEANGEGLDAIFSSDYKIKLWNEQCDVTNRDLLWASLEPMYECDYD